MKITCPKERLLVAISQIQGAVSPRTTLPILANVLLEAQAPLEAEPQTGLEGMLTLTATDLDIGIQYKISVNVSEPGSTTLPAKRLFGIIRELPEGDVEISVNNTHVAVITCGSAYFRVVGLGREEYPKLPEFPEAKTFELPQDLLKDMINKTSYAMCHDESRYVLNGTYLVAKSNKIIMVATDGRRLAFIEKHADLPKGTEIESIIPSKTVQELVKLLSSEGVVNIALAKNQIAFRLPDCMLISRLVEGNFPNYKQVIPDRLDQKITINKEELLSAVKRSTLITNDRSNSIKLNFIPNRLVISANTPDVGESRESINVPYEGKEIEVAFNPNFIIDVLRNLEDQEIFLEVTDGANPGIIRTGPDFLYVIMPMKLT